MSTAAKVRDFLAQHLWDVALLWHEEADHPDEWRDCREQQCAYYRSILNPDLVAAARARDTRVRQETVDRLRPWLEHHRHDNPCRSLLVGEDVLPPCSCGLETATDA